MAKNIEVEDGEIAIQNESGDIAIIPKRDVAMVKRMIKNPAKLDEYISNLPKMADYAEDGSLVYQIWEEKTGTPWKTAHSQGLTSGSYEDNMKLRSDLLAGKYDKNISQQATGDEGTFSEAFAKAREEQGPNGQFKWNGKVYGTKYKDEVSNKPAPKKSPVEEPKNKFDDLIKNSITQGLKEGAKTTPSPVTPAAKPSPTMDTPEEEKNLTKLFNAALKASIKPVEKSEPSKQEKARLKRSQALIDQLDKQEEIQKEPWYKDITDSIKDELNNYKEGMKAIKSGIDATVQMEADLIEHGSSWVKKKLMESTDLVEAQDDVIKEETVAPVAKEAPKKKAGAKFTEIFKEQTGYQKLGDAKSWRTGYDVHSFTNAFDNDQGYDYTPIPNAGNSTDETYDSPGVAHFLLDADMSGDSPYTHEYSKQYIKQQLSGTNIQGGSTVEDQYFPVMTKKDNGKVNVKYKTKDELKPGDIDKINAPLRQYRYTDLDWNGKPVPHPAFNSSVVSVPVKKTWKQDGKDTKHSHFIYAKASGDKSYGDFSGAGVVFIVNKDGKRLIVDYSGSVNNIKNKGQSLINKYNLKPEDLIIGFHDLGSFNSKPSGKNNKLKYSPKKFNPKPWTGGALAF